MTGTISEENCNVLTVPDALMVNSLPHSPPDTTSAFTPETAWWRASLHCWWTDEPQDFFTRRWCGLYPVPLLVKRSRPPRCHWPQCGNFVLCLNSDKNETMTSRFYSLILFSAFWWALLDSSAKIAEFSSLCLVKRNLKLVWLLSSSGLPVSSQDCVSLHAVLIASLEAHT